jgi:hypothetical protein
MARTLTQIRQKSDISSRPNYAAWRSAFRAPFRDLSPGELLAHFRQRTSVNYFPVADPDETTRTKIDNMLAHRFEFNGELYTLPERINWQSNPSRDIEWLILLHKFYYAVGLGMAYEETRRDEYARQWVRLVDSWIDQVSTDFLSSDVIGRRLQNWIFSHWYFVGGSGDARLNPSPSIRPEFYCRFLKSIHDQTTHLRSHLTPARNHRTIELYAIFLVAIVFPEFKSSSEWLKFAIDELAKNIAADFREDGVHCEQSTNYHHLVLKNYLGAKQLAVRNNILLPDVIDNAIRRAVEFSAFVHKPDGFIPSLSDGDSRCFLPLLQQAAELYDDDTWLYVATQGERGRPPRQRSKAFPSGGYYLLRSGWGEHEPFRDEQYLVFDCGPLGAGNHGHFDCLNIELAAYGKSLIVDPGRYTYDESGDTNWRAVFRGTAYHNTVLVDGKNQTRYQAQQPRYKIDSPEPDFEMRSCSFSRKPESSEARANVCSIPQTETLVGAVSAPVGSDRSKKSLTAPHRTPARASEVGSQIAVVVVPHRFRCHAHSRNRHGRVGIPQRSQAAAIGTAARSRVRCPPHRRTIGAEVNTNDCGT